MNYFELISIAYKSRLIFRTDAEYRKVLGTTFETIVAKRESKRDMEVYYRTLAQKTALVIDRPLDDIIKNYIVASDVYLSLDWGDRTQLASRKKFCRMLFRLSATVGRELSNDEIFKFKTKDADKELLRIFFPDGMQDAPVTIICFILLFAFGIIKPWTGDNSRSHDIRDKDTTDSLIKLLALIKQLKDDTPRLGSLEKPLVYKDWINNIENHIHNFELLSECTPLMMLTSLIDISQGCRSIEIPEVQRVSLEQFQGLYMHGIWIDDADNGQNRFWIFPDNVLSAMCFRREGIVWTMDPYDFRVREAFNSSYMDRFIILSPSGNLCYTLWPEVVASDEQICTGSCERMGDNGKGEFDLLKFYEDPYTFPKWMDWHEWKKLDSNDPKFKEFRSVLFEIYNPLSPHHILFTNSAPELSDEVNNMVGQDNKYLYVYDWQPSKFVIKEKTLGVFTYECDCNEYETMNSLFDLNISEEHPLYAIPKQMERRNYGNSQLKRFSEIMTDAENITEVYVIHSDRIKYPRLVLPTYGFSIKLDMDELSKIGIKKFTSRPF